ncbi:putative HemK methyltransferase family member 2 [Hypsibius exemplaris]|uniref:Methyltransferase HEMK2 n=1 Tax=Hypsibius exemplaris TaxID=2072580 RepID=A0A1W0X7I7_HYPEX|nr:putative HemK methyltransferase family member 2 [Hypsibius exemplaris]
MAFSTPRTGHLSEARFESVYEPVEDSFLFLDALELNWEFITKLKPSICLEIGCGSGIISTFICQNLHGLSECFMLCVDINPSAVQATQATFAGNINRKSAVFDTVLGNLATGLLPVSHGTVDLILFNPPYVVTTTEELETGDLASKAWAGGVNGREVLDKFFPQAVELLSRDGAMYCVALKENNIEDIQATVSALGLQTDIILSRRCRNELLHILRFTRKQKDTPT